MVDEYLPTEIIIRSYGEMIIPQTGRAEPVVRKTTVDLAVSRINAVRFANGSVLEGMDSVVMFSDDEGISISWRDDDGDFTHPLYVLKRVENTAHEYVFTNGVLAVSFVDNK